MALRTFCAVGLAIAALVQAQKPERLTFEVASIKLANPDERGGGIKAMPGGQRYVATNVPVKLIFSLMYKVPLRQITGGPAWLDSERYDIEATAAHSYDLDDLHTMFQNLLADEFKLRFHKEIREGSVYALSVDKAGSKMKLNQTPQDFKIPNEYREGRGSYWDQSSHELPVLVALADRAGSGGAAGDRPDRAGSVLRFHAGIRAGAAPGSERGEPAAGTFGSPEHLHGLEGAAWAEVGTAEGAGGVLRDRPR
jgi:hypothetical protein